jgi:hypothetical protein
MLSKQEKTYWDLFIKKPNKTPKETGKLFALMMKHKQEYLKENRKIDLRR